MKCDIVIFQLPIIRILESHKQHTFTRSQVSELSFSFNSAVEIQISGVRIPILLCSNRSDCVNFWIDDISFQNNLRIVFPDFSSGYGIIGGTLHRLLKLDSITVVISEQILNFYCLIVPGSAEVIHHIIWTVLFFKVIFRHGFLVCILSDIHADHQ